MIDTLAKLKVALQDLVNRSREDDDPEHYHAEADKLLLEYICDPEVIDLFKSIKKYYA